MFFTSKPSALSLRALKKHLTSFKRLSRLFHQGNDYRCSFELGGEGRGQNYRAFGSLRFLLFLPLHFLLFPLFSFNDWYLLTRGEGRREQRGVEIDFIIGEREVSKLVVWVRQAR